MSCADHLAINVQSVLFVYLLQFAAFGAFYTIGNLCLLGRYGLINDANLIGLHQGLRRCVSANSSLFLIGPMRQMKMMFHPVRLIATLIYLGALGLTLFVAIYVCTNLVLFTVRLPR